MIVYIALSYSFPNFGPFSCSMSGSNCWFCIQVFQKTGKVVWYSHLLQIFPQFVVIHTIEGFSVVNEAEVDVLLEFPFFLRDSFSFGNLIFGSSANSKPSLSIGKFHSRTAKAYLWRLLSITLLACETSAIVQ